ncbi:MAG: transporter [Chitinophagaceae bacterium]|nr:MAG: transporter [Chitinophagaceae bacterium]
MQTHLGTQGQRTPITADETYQSSELWAGLNIGEKFRLLTFVPYNFNNRETQSSFGSKNGLGDIALMGYYNLLTKASTLGDKLLVQSLWLGTGIKAPTGKYEAAEQIALQDSPNNFQLGTASTDFSFNAAYDLRYNDIGLNTNLNYKVNTENNFHYHYGNKFTLNTLLYAKFRIAQRFTLAPNAGILFETAGKDVENKKFEVTTSGGYSLCAVVGAEFAMKAFSFGANYQNIEAQNLADGRAIAGNRVMIHISIPF